MGKLIYGMIASLDGYIEDEAGNFDWAEPDAEAHAFINALEKPVGTYLYGRRMYETMKGWDSDQPFFAQSPVYQDFATQWRAARKIVYSSTLDRVTTSNTSLGRELTHKALEQLKAESDAPIAIAGPDLARTAFEAGLVDECHVFLGPVVVGGGKRFLPKGIHLPLELVDEKRFKGGFVYLGYRRRS